jgi:hypothetical protein
MDYANFRRKLGLLAEKQAQAQYKIARPNQHWIIDEEIVISGGNPLRISNVPAQPLTYTDPYLGWLMEALRTKKGALYTGEPSTAGKSRRPDLGSVEVHEVYEVKPDTPEKRAEGLRQLEVFRSLLQSGDKQYVEFSRSNSKYLSKVYPRLQNTIWTLGTTFCPLPTGPLPFDSMGNVKFTYARPTGGLIVWKTDGESGKARERAIAFAADYLKAIKEIPLAEGGAEKLARELVRTNELLGDAVLQLILGFGVAVVLIALTVVVSEALAIAAATAVVFAFVYSLVQTANRPFAPPIRLS